MQNGEPIYYARRPFWQAVGIQMLATIAAGLILFFVLPRR